MSRDAARDIPRTTKALARPRHERPPSTCEERVHSNWQGSPDNWCEWRGASGRIEPASDSSRRIAIRLAHTAPTAAGWMKRFAMYYTPGGKRARRRSRLLRTMKYECRCGGKLAGAVALERDAAGYPVPAPWSGAWKK